MKKNFWKKLKKPIFCLAPMFDVTDSAFRKMIAKYGKPEVMWTEFVSADGLASRGKDRLMHLLKYTNKERPIVAQIFSSNPEAIRKASTLVVELGFDGLDINMGCPDKAVLKQGAGAGLIRIPQLAIQIIEAAKEGIKMARIDRKSERSGLRKTNVFRDIPVSVKTRIGFNTIDLDWIRILLEQRLPALVVHLRTKKELSLVPAHWEVMPEIVRMRDEISPETLLIGNGDVTDTKDGLKKIKESGCDGVMIGRGVFGRPWLFRDVEHPGRPNRKENGQKARKPVRDVPHPETEKLAILLEHTRHFEKDFKGIKNFDVMKKHFKAYVSGWDGAKELRIKLMECKNYAEVKELINTQLELYK